MSEADFMDSHHLLPDAAEAFSARLGREVLVLLRRGRDPSQECGLPNASAQRR
jgi:hypothetical protein